MFQQQFRTQSHKILFSLMAALLFGGFLLVGLLSAAPTGGDEPFFESDGTILPGPPIVPQFPQFDGDRDFNFALTITGTESVELVISNGGGTPIWNGVVEAGETVWGTATLTDGLNRFTMTNQGGTAVSYHLRAYDLPDAPYAWDGDASATGLNSHIRVNFPQAGLYTFDLGVANGRYQFLLGSDYIQKTAETDTSVTYFVPAGIHDLHIDQDTAVGADWDVTISGPGAANDSLPYSKSGGDIGGVGNDYSQEWLPINLATAAEVNVAITITGSISGLVNVQIFDESAELAATSALAGETHWMTLDMPAGTSRIKVTAAAPNTDPLAYDLSIQALPSPDYTWAGEADAAGENSHARVTFATAGLYTFNLEGSRYQFLLNENTIQKTVERATDVTYYVPAGTHDLWIDQDTATGADWSVTISETAATVDTLPYVKTGGELGGAGNDFDEEWLTVHTGSDVMVNLVITLTGSVSDSLSLEIWDAISETLTLAPVYGSETVWVTTMLPGDGRIHLTAPGNDSPLSYELAIRSIPSVTATFYGRSLGNGENSLVQVDLPADGEYLVQVIYPEGLLNFLPNSLVHLTNGSIFGGGGVIEYSLNREAGPITFIAQQDPAFPVTPWTATISLVEADPPAVTDVNPDMVDQGSGAAITITGSNFMPGATAKLVDGANEYPLQSVSRVAATTLTAVVPTNVPIGTYDVTVTNPDQQSASLLNALGVGEEIVIDDYLIYLPIIQKP
jgi:hypothetical protein